MKNTKTKTKSKAANEVNTRIFVESGFGRVINELKKSNVFLVVDHNVYKCYSNELNFDIPKFVMKAGESNKTLQTVGDIITAMLEHKCNRKTRLIALGGGVVGDTAGFAAASFMRGTEWVSIPTTLLSQVDSGVGGKTGVNIGNRKNMAGAFWAPKKVIVSCDFLGTLPEREWLSGIGEVVKTAILDPAVWELVYKNRLLLDRHDPRLYERIVKACIDFKDKITKRDFREGGLRMILNLGHTVGHALESVDGYRLSHGEYVAWGILHELRINEELIEPSFLPQARELVGSVLCCRSDPYSKYDKLVVAKYMRSDKKNTGSKVTFVVPTDLGLTEVVEKNI